MARTLVTGSHGFVGRHLASELEDSHRVIYYDRKMGLELEDLPDSDFEVDYIFHLAGSCSTPRSFKDPIGDFNDNAKGTLSMLEFARKTGAKVIHTSTCKAQDPVRTPYGVSKRTAEMYCREYTESFGVPVIINRPGTIYGEGQEGSEESGWVAWFLKAKELGLPVTIYGDGKQTRDLLYVGDYTRLLLTQMGNFDKYQGRTYDVGGGKENEVSVNNLADYLGLERKHAPARIGDARRYVASNHVEGWSPKTHWEDKL